MITDIFVSFSTAERYGYIVMNLAEPIYEINKLDVQEMRNFLIRKGNRNPVILNFIPLPIRSE